MKYLLTLLLCMGVAWSYAQDAIVEGTVTDLEGTPLIGANVITKDTSTALDEVVVLGSRRPEKITECDYCDGLCSPN
ncbi:MAG: hypothetical protein AAF599_03715 [Bacteroidota bacterium]